MPDTCRVLQLGVLLLYLALELGRRRADKRRVVDQAVFRGVVLGLEGAEQSLLCAKDLRRQAIGGVSKGGVLLDVFVWVTLRT